MIKRKDSLYFFLILHELHKLRSCNRNSADIYKSELHGNKITCHSDEFSPIPFCSINVALSDLVQLARPQEPWWPDADYFIAWFVITICCFLRSGHWLIFSYRLWRPILSAFSCSMKGRNQNPQFWHSVLGEASGTMIVLCSENL